MGFTYEQNAVIESAGNVSVLAGPGTGKTHTLMEYAKRRNGKKILYLVYNRAMRLEAADKFRRAGCTTTTVETIHSLAYRAMNVGTKYQLHQNGSFRPHEVVEVCGSPVRDKTLSLMIAAHALRLLSRYCNGDEFRVADIDYVSELTNPEAQSFAERKIHDIEGLAKRLFDLMKAGSLPITHDGYLKLFQLSGPKLSQEFILLDEAQDVNPVMLALIRSQDHATRVAVGDPNQQIYGWRYARNSLDILGFRKLHLTESFRFNNGVARLAMMALDFKKGLSGADHGTSLTGVGNSVTQRVNAVIARTNLELLGRAISILDNGKIGRFHFEGGLKSYTYLQEGSGIYDVLALHAKRRDLIRSNLIKAFESLTDLEEYSKETEDRELGLIIALVKNYGTNLYSLLKSLKDLEVSKDKANLIFTTAHRAKGQEYDVVNLCDDFISITDVADYCKFGSKKKPIEVMLEEVNLLYVGITRAKTDALVPKSLFTLEDRRSDRGAEWKMAVG